MFERDDAEYAFEQFRGKHRLELSGLLGGVVDA